MIRIEAIWLAVDPLDMRAGTDTALARVVTNPHPDLLTIQRAIDALSAPVKLSVSSGGSIALGDGTSMVAGVISLHVMELFHAEGRIGRITSLV